ncbi:MAG: DEAD/DEAH box helicase [Deltaproteobacteria bacterium]|nr:DEAD/DEAH box helicase [Deltaproteobacteria bacterium]
MQDHDTPQHPRLFEKLSQTLREDEAGFLQLGYHIEFLPRHGVLAIKVVQGDEVITRFEKFGIHALGLHREGTPQSELDPDHRRFAQHLLRFANLNASEGFYAVPRKHIAFFLSKLAKFPQVEFMGDRGLVRFSEQALVPLVELLEQTKSHVRMRASFQDADTLKEYSFGAASVFVGPRIWILIGETFYPIKTTVLSPMLSDFTLEGELVLTGNEAADFIQDYLPQLARKPQMILPEGFHVPEILEAKPETVYSIREDTVEGKLILDILFSYGEHRVPPYEQEGDVLVEIPQEGKKLLIRRDLAFEKETLGRFIEQGFHRVGPTRFETGEEKALDFIAETLPKMKEQESLEGEDALQHFKLFGDLGAVQLKARAVSGGIDWLEMDLAFEIDGMEVPYEVVQTLIAQGKRYLHLPGKGFARIQKEDLQKLEEKLAELEGELDASGHLRVSSYHAAYLDETLSIDWTQRQDFGSMIRSLRHSSEIPQRELPASLSAVLRDYQHHGYDWLHFLNDHRFHGILADDMGLGKTIQALAYLQDRHDRQGSMPNLILAPTSVVFNWANEAQKFTPNLKVLILTGPDRKKLFKEIAEADLVLTSYALFRRDVEVLTQQKWRTVVLDEAQNIKNFRSKTALLVKELQAEQRWALSGTPLENHLSELWSIFDFLMPGFLGSYPHFKRKYQQPVENEQSSEQLERLRRRIFPFILRRLKDEVAKELPPKTEVVQYCEMTGEQQKLYHEVLASCRRQVFAEVEQKGIERSQVSILTALLRLRQVCCHPELLGPTFKKRDIASGKMETFQDLVTEVLSEGHRILVFSQFVEMLSLLRLWLDKEKIAYEYLDGRTRRREDKIKRFNTDENIPIFLVSLRAGGTGLNLTGADYVIHYDPWWNPAVQDQATDRVHRLGQTKHVFSYKLITKDSVEEKILMLQERKRSLAKGLLGSDSALGKKLKIEDLEYLFS